MEDLNDGNVGRSRDDSLDISDAEQECDDVEETDDAHGDHASEDGDRSDA